jgi:hypothetical protein
MFSTIFPHDRTCLGQKDIIEFDVWTWRTHVRIWWRSESTCSLSCWHMFGHAHYMSGRRRGKLNSIFSLMAGFVLFWKGLSCKIFMKSHRSLESLVVLSTTFIVFIHVVLRVVCQEIICMKWRRLEYKSNHDVAASLFNIRILPVGPLENLKEIGQWVTRACWGSREASEELVYTQSLSISRVVSVFW